MRCRKDNLTTAQNGHGPEESLPERFTHIAWSAPSLFRPFRIDGENHIATGVMIDTNGEGHRADLSYDQGTGTVVLTVRAKPNGPITPDRQCSLTRIQNTVKLARVAYDEENRLVVFDAGSICRGHDDAAFVMRGILAHLGRILTDGRLGHVIQQ